MFPSEAMKARASRNAREAFKAERARTRLFGGGEGSSEGSVEGEGGAEGEGAKPGDHAQPAIFRGTLKGYQLKGMNWLANLYDQVYILLGKVPSLVLPLIAPYKLCLVSLISMPSNYAGDIAFDVTVWW